MDNKIRKFFSNFQKHGTISRNTYNVMKHKTSIKNNKVKGTAVLETGANTLVTNEEMLQQHTKSTTGSIKECNDIKLSEFNSQETMHIDTSENVSADETKTHTCLKEFDKIQKVVHRDIPKECGSFNEIEDSLNNVSDVDRHQATGDRHLRQADDLRCLQFEIPRFDLQDLIQGFDEENIIGPNNLNIADAPNLEHNNSQSIEDTVNIIDINTNANEADVISISSEDSQSHMTNLLSVKNNMNEFSTHESKNDESKNVNYEINEDSNKGANNIHKPTEDTVNFGFTNIQDEDVISITSADSQAHIPNVITEENIETHEPRNAELNNINLKILINDEPHEANNIVITKQDADVISISSEDSQAHINLIPEEYTETNTPRNIEPNNVNNDKAEPRLKNVVFIDHSDEGEPENVGNKNKDGDYKPENVNEETTIKALDIDVMMDSEDDCGYQSSDFEFITEDEAKLDGLVINFNPDNNVNIKSSKLKRVKTIEVAPDMFTGKISIPSPRIRAGQSNVQDSFNTNMPRYCLSNTTGPDNQDSELMKPSNNTGPNLRRFRRINCISSGDIKIHNPRNPSSEQVQNIQILRNPEPNPETYNLSKPSSAEPGVTIQTKAEPNDPLKLNYAGSGIQNIDLVGNSSHSQLHYPGYSDNGIEPNYFQRNFIEASQIEDVDYSGLNYPGPSYFQRNDPEPYRLQELHPVVNNDAPGPSYFGRNCPNQEDYPGFNNDGPGPSYLQRNCPERNQLQELHPVVNNDGPGPSYFRRNCPKQEDYAGFNNNSPGPSYLQENCPESSQLQEVYPTFNNDGPGPSYIKKKCPESSQLQEVYPGVNNDGPGPSYFQRNDPDTNNFESYISQDNAGPSNSQRDAEMSDRRIERWRAFRHRNENQFILDYSYRENHRLLNADEYYRLFDPNNGPLPNQYIQPMENKSTMSTSVMLVQYNGVGFDMQMLQDSNDDDDEVKEEANKSAQMILEMYPSENRKRRRRRF